MQFKLEFTGDYYEDRDLMNRLTKVSDMWLAISDARELIRGRIKYSEDLTKPEVQFLELLRHELDVPGLDE